MEIYVESLRAQTVWIAGIGMEIQFRKGERIHTENSYKFTDAMVESVVRAGGFVLERCWKDPRRWFGVYLARI
jgi:L-histidine N-alpha-methyltransferase